MEAPEKNFMPEIKLFELPEWVKQIGHCALRVATLRGFLPEDAPDYLSEHYRGGAAALDRALYDDPYISAGSYYLKKDIFPK